MDSVTLFTLLAASVLVTAFARRKGWPAPLLIVALALAASFIPGLPEFAIEPDVILTLVLPPLLYSSALDVSVVNFRAVGGPIWRLGIALVVATAFAAGAIAFWLIPDMTWPVALLVGAIVAPPDAVSAVAIGRRVGLPRHIMTILTGESLVNDATSLTLFKVALAIVGGASLTLSQDAGIFLVAVLVGVGLGAIVGLVYQALKQRLADPPVQILLGLLLPFFIYVGAEHLGGSGVLGVVTAGLIVGYNAPKSSYVLRLEERPVWTALNVLLEAFVFALIGLQFHSIVANLVSSDRGLWWSVGISLAVFAVCVIVRFLFVFSTSTLSNGQIRREARELAAGGGGGRQRMAPGGRPHPRTGPHLGHRSPSPRDGRGEVELSWQQMFVISWSGMRGVVTLAAAASVPAITATGLHVPAHDTIVLIAFVVTVGSLLLQGLSLPLVVRLLHVADPDRDAKDAEATSRFMKMSMEESFRGIVADAAQHPEKYHGIDVEKIVKEMRQRAERIESDSPVITPADAVLPAGSPAVSTGAVVPASGTGRPDMQKVMSSMVALRRDLLRRRREILVRERNAGNLDEEVLREIQLSFDADELSLDNLLIRERPE